MLRNLQYTKGVYIYIQFKGDEGSVFSLVVDVGRGVYSRAAFNGVNTVLRSMQHIQLTRIETMVMTVCITRECTYSVAEGVENARKKHVTLATPTQKFTLGIGAVIGVV